MLEHPDTGTAETDSEPYGRVIEFIADNEAALVHERRDKRRVGGKTHGANESVLHANKTGDKGLRHNMQITGASLHASTKSRDSILPDGFFYGVRAASTSLGKTKVIV